MWYKISRFILLYRFYLLAVICGITLFMAFKAKEAQMDYSFSKIIPEDHPRYIDYVNFREKFGEDGNILVVAVENKHAFRLDHFRHWCDLGNDISNIAGIEEVFSICHAYELEKDTAQKKFRLLPIVRERPQSQQDVDSIRQVFESLPFYANTLYNPENNTILLAARFDERKLNSKDRDIMVTEIQKLADEFRLKTGLDVHLSGLPFIRSYNVISISKEVKISLVYAILVLSLVLLILFKSLYAVVFPMFVVGIGVIWAQGLMVLFGYKITLLTALIPNLMVVIGIPNCIYLLNKYHNEFKKHGNKVRALTRVVEKVGYSIFFANLTTAIGFGVFYFTESRIFQEFGIASFVMVFTLFVISVITIPVIFSFLPKPKRRATKYLDSVLLNRQLRFFDWLTSKHKKVVFGATIILMVVAAGGMLRLKTNGFLLDDVPKDSKVYRDLKFVESKFKGLMPVEILIDSKKPGGIMKLKTLKKIDEAQDSLFAHPLFSKPTSVVEGLKFATQAYYNGNPKHYRLPRDNFTMPELGFILPYLNNSSAHANVARSFVDSSKQVARISVQIPDIGSHRQQELQDALHSVFDPIFDSENYSVTFTGATIVAMEGYKYLVNGLLNSVLLAFVLIAIIMAFLFRSFKILVISLIPNIVPLFITAGIMGYFNIPLKPSTVLVFSVAFGLSVDFTIHFLAKCRQERGRHTWDISKVVSSAIRETGISMIYTSVILFFGFITFATSSFDGTKYLGILVSITLAASMFSNMLLLPSLLLVFDKDKKSKSQTLQAQA